MSRIQSEADYFLAEDKDPDWVFKERINRKIGTYLLFPINVHNTLQEKHRVKKWKIIMISTSCEKYF